VEDSIVMHDTRVKSGARLTRAIVDKSVVIGADALVGAASASQPADLCVIGKGSVVPARTRIGPRTLIEIGVSDRDYPGRDVPPGSVIRPGASR
jgi:ADP-glucose pyrophosphorylase